MSLALDHLSALLSVAALTLAPMDRAPSDIEYLLVGQLVKDPTSDNLFNSKQERIAFKIRIRADPRFAIRVPAGTPTSIPNFAKLKFREDAYRLPPEALTLFMFEAPGSNAVFSRKDVIADESTGATVVLTGSLTQPSGATLLLANGVSGIVQVGIPECERTCDLKGGLVLDRAGPFGTITGTKVQTLLRAH
jgi:hypothetical protein